MDNRVPYVWHSETSKEAAKSIEPSAGTWEGIVLDHIRSQGKHGATADECLHELGLTHQNGSARVSTLAKKGLIIRTNTKRLTRSGRRAFVYVSKENCNEHQGRA